jgi:hypothetical protein
MRSANLLMCLALYALVCGAKEPMPATDALNHRAQEHSVVESIGLPVYPGAREGTDDNFSHPVTVSDIGIASVEGYRTGDSAERVLEFYRRELEQHGQVLECRSGKPVNPSALRRGLACDGKQNRGSVMLKSGSGRNVFAVVVSSQGKQTLFTLVRALSPHDVGLAQP